MAENRDHPQLPAVVSAARGDRYEWWLPKEAASSFGSSHPLALPTHHLCLGVFACRDLPGEKDFTYKREEKTWLRLVNSTLSYENISLLQGFIAGSFGNCARLCWENNAFDSYRQVQYSSHACHTLQLSSFMFPGASLLNFDQDSCFHRSFKLYKS